MVLPSFGSFEMDIAAMVAAFEAKGGKVQKVSEGERAIESDRAIYAAMRNGGRVAADVVRTDRESERLAHAQRDAFDAAKYDGWTNDDAYQYAQEAK